MLRNFYVRNVRKIYVRKLNSGNTWKVSRKRKSWTSLNFSFNLNTNPNPFFSLVRALRLYMTLNRAFKVSLRSVQLLVALSNNDEFVPTPY